ncbi:MAG: hypothetical protein GX638_03960, partial [Crenarchaeota archaeon]|nr:hypothetical protein [Thermoproteota archaeon]
MIQPPNRKNRGQVLIVSSLVIILLLISTFVYVIEIQKNTPIDHSEPTNDFAAIKQAAIHTAISALANITKGGNT